MRGRRRAGPLPGQTVKAYVKLTEGHGLTREDLAEFLRDKLSPIEIPKHLEIRDELPKTMIGKLSRKALLEEEEARRSDRQAPRD
ncbi:AMP-binding enzyme [Skermanella pratensis]|uniref:AMP-binding enzyme n=1 Tax=Skermanella pratensis TaxID=2233999 RepID=UPI0031B57581